MIVKVGDVFLTALTRLQVEGVEQLVCGEGPSGFGLPAMLQQYVEHGGCLFKVSLCVTAGGACHIFCKPDYTFVLFCFRIRQW